MRHQGSHDILIVGIGRHVEGRHAVLIASVHVGPELDEEEDDVLVAGRCRLHQRQEPVLLADGKDPLYLL